VQLKSFQNTLSSTFLGERQLGDRIHRPDAEFIPVFLKIKSGCSGAMTVNVEGHQEMGKK
jgi:hypothetical protein